MPRTARIAAPAAAALAALLFAFTLTTSGSPALAVEDCIAAPEPRVPEGGHWYYRTDRATQRRCWFVGPKNLNAEQAAPRAPAQAADCVAAPEPRTPEGSHWYYRIDRATQRKCWYLAPQDRKVENAASRVQPRVATAAEPATSAEERLTQRAQRELQNIQPWPATNAGDTVPVAASAAQWTDPPDTIKPDEAPTNAADRQENRTHERQALDGLGVPDQPPVQQSVIVADTTAHSPTGAQMPLLLLITGALGLAGVLVRAIHGVALARQRRVYVERYDANSKMTSSQSPVSATVSTRDPPARPPLELIHRHHEVDEALRQSSRPWKRRAA